MNKALTMMLTLLLALGGLTAFVPTTVAQTGELVVPDNPGDVALYPGTSAGGGQAPPPEPVPVTVPGDIAGPADLTGFKVYGETATTVSFQISVDDFSRPNTWQPSKLYYALCFDWSGTGGTYRFWWEFAFGNQPSAEANIFAKFQLGTFARVEDCAPHKVAGRSNELMTQSYAVFTHEYNPNEKTLSWTVPRRLFEELHPDNSATGALDPRPQSGESFSNLRAYAVTQATNGYFTFDGTDSGEFPLALDTGNEKVRVVVPANVATAFGVGGADTPIYGVEIGSFQTIPVTIENYLETPIEPNITVTMIAGEPGKWEVRTLPSIPVPRMVGEEPGRATVTLIVNSDPTVKHKESVRLLIMALDQTQPAHLGAQAVDVVAVNPPLPGEATLYFHGTGSACSWRERWINTLSEDSKAIGAEIGFQSCDPTGSGGGSEGSYIFRPDVPFARDYVLSTTENAKVSLVMRSVHRAGNMGQDVEVPSIVDIKVELLSGSTVVGEHVVKNQQVGGQPTPVDFAVPIQGQILGGFGRAIPNDKGLGVRISVAPAARVIETGGFCVQPNVCIPEEERPVSTPGGRIFMAYGASKITVPISSSERSGDHINITKSGALISMRLSEGERHVFTNPGRIVVFNVTVRNEGVNVDTAKISATLNQTGWKAEILPTASFKLKVGEPRSFNVRVVAPAGGLEGQSLRLDLFATSTVDKNAVAKLPLTIEITTGEQFEDQQIDPGLQKLDETKDSPGIGLPLVLFGVLALVGLGRMRRRE